MAWDGAHRVSVPLATKVRTCTYEGGANPCKCKYTCANGGSADDDDGPWNVCNADQCDGFSDDCGHDSTSEWLAYSKAACPEPKLGPEPEIEPEQEGDDGGDDILDDLLLGGLVGGAGALADPIPGDEAAGVGLGSG